MGFEPTGHYWLALATWMISNGMTAAWVNPYAVKQSKEIEDNSQRKDDMKDPKVIANLVKNGKGAHHIFRERYMQRSACYHPFGMRSAKI